MLRSGVAERPARPDSPASLSRPPGRLRSLTAQPAGGVIAALLAGLALTCLARGNVVTHLGGGVPASPYDPLMQAWQVAWTGHALLHQPLHMFDANAFWPLHDSLAFSDSLFGYAPAGLLGSGPADALLRYDLLFLFAYAFAFAGAWALARALRMGPVASAVGAAAFAFAPWRLGQDDHLNILSSGGIPLAFALLIHGYRRRRPPAVLAGFAVAAWQVTLGFSLGLWFLYVLAAAGLLALLRPGGRRALLDQRMWAAGIGGAALLVLCVALVSRPYFEVRSQHPESRRSAAEAKLYSPPPSGLLVAPSNNLIWAGATSGLRGRLPAPFEDAIFPGAAVLLLAALGVWLGPLPLRLRLVLLGCALLAAVLSLGLRGPPGVYRFAFDHLPGWNGIRTPGRLTTFTSLALALLAGAGSQVVIAAVDRRSGSRRIAAAAGVALIAALVVEGSGPVAVVEAPNSPRAVAEAPGPLFMLPSNVFTDPGYVLSTTDRFQPIVNGTNGFFPTTQAAFRSAAGSFPSRPSVAWLRSRGVRTVVIDTLVSSAYPPSYYAQINPPPAIGASPEAAVVDPPWAAAARRSIAGLGITRTTAGRFAVFDLHPAAPVR